MPLIANEGPIGLIICPSRELARQTWEVVQGFVDALKADGMPELRTMLCMGGVDTRTQVNTHTHTAQHLALTGHRILLTGHRILL